MRHSDQVKRKEGIEMTTNDIRIRTIFYFATGREQSTHDCESVQAAFDRCVRMNMDANVHPVGTTKGVYVWRPGVNNTIESMANKLEDIVIDSYGCSRNVARIRLGANMLAPDGMTVWPWDERVMEVSTRILVPAHPPISGERNF